MFDFYRLLSPCPRQLKRLPNAIHVWNVFSTVQYPAHKYVSCRTSDRAKRWMYNVFIFVVDLVEVIFWPKPKPRKLRVVGGLSHLELPAVLIVLLKLSDTDVIYLDDEELFRRASAGPPLLGAFRESCYRMFGTEIVAKFVLDIYQENPDLNREVMALRCIAEQTTIPVPRVYRAVRRDQWTVIMMDFIDGERLDHAWPKLSLWSRIRVGWTLWSYVRQLQRIVVGPCAFTGPRAPEPSPSDKRALSMRDVILRKDGAVWLLDWNFAASSYPKYLEYLGM